MAGLMFSSEEWEVVLPWAIAKIRGEIAKPRGQVRIANSTGIKPPTINRWKPDSADPKNPGQASVLKIIERHWKMDRAAVLRAAGRRPGPSPIPDPMPARVCRDPMTGDIPSTLAEAIQMRLGRWAGSTIDGLIQMARSTGLRRSVGAWIDCGDELDAIASTALDSEETLPTGVHERRKA